MKKPLLTTLGIVTTLFCIAQIPNGGFEDWANKGTYVEPTEWVTTNGLTQLGNPPSVFKSTDAHSGTSACEIITAKITTKIPGIFIPDYAGSIFTGAQVGVNSKHGFPYTNKPTKLGFWYKYNARNADTATILVMTTRWNTTTSQRDTISFGYDMLKDSVGIYTKHETMLWIYDSINSPDSAVVIISAAGIYTTHDSAKLLLDDMAFEGGNVGLSESKTAYTFGTYPNPASASGFHLVLDPMTTDALITIYDLNGKIVHKQSQEKTTDLFIETRHLSSGFYFIQVSSPSGNGIQKLIVE